MNMTDYLQALLALNKLVNVGIIFLLKMEKSKLFPFIECVKLPMR